MSFSFDIPHWRKIRLIVNTDAKNEADDQYAIAHALLTPRFIVKGIIAAQFENNAEGTGRVDTMLQSYDEACKIIELMDMTGRVPVYKGAASALPSEHDSLMSEGAEAIIKEAMAEDDKPLYVVFLGPLTDLAAAYLTEPRIGSRLKAIWIGGAAWPRGGWEFNLRNDIHAANVVMNSNIELWQVPNQVYCTMRVSIAELMYKVKPYGKIGEYLFRQLMEYNEQATSPGWPKGEMWAMGDSPAISLLLDEHDYGYELKPAPRITSDMYYVHHQTERKIRVYHTVDARFTLEDLFAKLALTYGAGARE